MFKVLEAAINYLFIANHNDPIRQYCQTEFKEDWKEQYYKLTGKTIDVKAALGAKGGKKG